MANFKLTELERHMLARAKKDGATYTATKRAKVAIDRLVERGLLVAQGSQFVPTPAGREYDTRPRLPYCPMCGGDGWFLGQSNCPACKGTGKNLHLPKQEG